MSSWMTGQNVNVLVSSNLGSPVGLTIDYHMNNRLFWCDQRTNFIESVKFDGSDRVKIVHVGLDNPFKIDIF